ncbi:histone deacetylase 11 isoform X1 [Leguminivora glycinivorella]|uniref:histone deacetylase 11 isoform X1 n=1 Tax=Leguminivora glycinivorella TaxID=1035111 RepID=UPI00201019BA|nr:histone deacetylase 11 isoform X1 [Leguminivora glycinivorella]
MTSLYFDIDENQWPLIYDEKYNVSVGGLEKFHVFDAKKWRNIIQYLKDAEFITDECLVKPNEAQKRDLRRVHTKRYLNSLKWSMKVAIIAEVPMVALLPNICVQYAYLKPMRLQTGGSVLAGKLALERGWAVNVGGGFHHCSGDRGGGFCPYADITLLIRFLMDSELIQNAMIVDLDAHQGNGYQHDFLGVPEVYIMDMYNRHIYPKDREAKQAIRRKIELGHRVEDLEYMLKLRHNLKAALNEFTPDILVYNAGTDILDSDPLGNLRVSSVGIIKRDEFVFEMCRSRKIPIVMLTSGGYLRKTARIIADSIMNLHSKGLITGQCPVPDED